MHSKDRVSARRSKTFLSDFLGKKAGRVRIEAKTMKTINDDAMFYTAGEEGEGAVGGVPARLLEVGAQET